MVPWAVDSSMQRVGVVGGGIRGRWDVGWRCGAVRWGGLRGWSAMVSGGGLGQWEGWGCGYGPLAREECG